MHGWSIREFVNFMYGKTRVPRCTLRRALGRIAQQRTTRPRSTAEVSPVARKRTCCVVHMPPAAAAAPCPCHLLVLAQLLPVGLAWGIRTRSMEFQ
jgi:hypothetical protein